MAGASLAVRLGAQIAEFQKAFTDATRTTEKFKTTFGGAASEIAKHQQRINRAMDDFSGDKIVREANAYAQAVQRIGGAAKLTEQEQRRVNAAVTEAIAKYQQLGQTAPQSLLNLAKATAQVQVPTAAAQRSTALFATSLDQVEQKSGLASRAMGAITGAFGKFTLAGLAVTAINNLVGSLSEFVQKGAQLGAVEQSFERLSGTVKQSGSEMLAAMRTSTRGLVSNFDLMLSANKAILLGLPVTTKEMGELAKTATVLGKAMGLDATQSLNDLITALGRSSPLILDNLGLTVKVGEANERYAQSLGKSVEALTEAEKKTAFYNAAMEAARKKTVELGDQTLTLGEHFKAAWTTIGNIVSSGVSFVNVELGKLISETKSAATGIVSFIRNIFNNGFRATAGQAIFSLQPPIPLPAPPPVAALVPPDYVKLLREAEAKVRSLTSAQLAQLDAAKKLGTGMEELAKRYGLNDAALKVLEARTKAKTKSDFQSILILDKTIDAIDDQIRSLERSQAAQRRAINMRPLDESTAAFFEFNKQLVQTGQFVDEFFAQWQARTRQIAVLRLEANTDDVVKKLEALTARFRRFTQDIKAVAISTAHGIAAALGEGIRSGDWSQFKDNLRDVLAEGLSQAAAAAVDFVIPGLGRILQPLFKGLADKLLDAFGLGTKGRDAVKDFAASFGGFDALRKKLFVLGAEGERLWKTLTQGVGRNNPEQAKKAIDAITAALDKQEQAWRDIGRVVDAVNKRTEIFGRQFANVTDKGKLAEIAQRTQPEFERLGTIVAGVFAAMVKHSGDAIGAINALAPSFELLKKGINEFGLTSTATIDRLIANFDLLNNEAFKGLFEQIQALGQIMEGLDAAKALDPATFQAIAADIGQSIQEIINRGGDMAQTLALSQPVLQKLWEAQQIYGRITDDTTQSILDQAQQQGLVGAHMKDVNQKILDVLLLIAEVLGADIPDALRGLPSAAKDAAKGISDELQKIDVPTIKIPFEFSWDSPFTGEHLLDGVPHLAAGGIVRRPTLALIGESGPERVEPLSRESASVRPSSGSVYVGTVTINTPSDDPQQMARDFWKEVRRGGKARELAFEALGLG